MQMGISPRSPCILPSTAYTASPSSLSTFTLSISDFLHSLSLSQFSAFFLFVDFASFAFFFFFFPCACREKISPIPLAAPGTWGKSSTTAARNTLISAPLCGSTQLGGGGEGGQSLIFRPELLKGRGLQEHSWGAWLPGATLPGRMGQLRWLRPGQGQ